MPKALFISHPEVVVDPQRPVPRWQLSDKGISRMRAFAESKSVAGIGAIWASSETKAIEAAGLLAGRFGLPVSVDAELGENDRSSTGFLPPDEFEWMADAFFAEPERSVRGWERAIDAQRRIIGVVEMILSGHRMGDLALVAHGGVGTLLLCHFLKEPISRNRDQPFQGHFWAFDVESRRVLHAWQPIA